MLHVNVSCCSEQDGEMEKWKDGERKPWWLVTFTKNSYISICVYIKTGNVLIHDQIRPDQTNVQQRNSHIICFIQFYSSVVSLPVPAPIPVPVSSYINTYELVSHPPRAAPFRFPPHVVVILVAEWNMSPVHCTLYTMHSIKCTANTRYNKYIKHTVTILKSD